MSVLFVIGVNDKSEVGAMPDKNGNIVLLHDGNIPGIYEIPLRKDFATSVFLFGKNQPDLRLPRKPSLIFNAIANPDTSRGALIRCAELCEHLQVPVINHPNHILKTTRDSVSTLLQGIPNIIMPRTVRRQPKNPDDVLELAKEAGIDFPFIFRGTGDHGGKSMTLVRHADDRDLLHIYPFDGRDFYITEYVECGGNDNQYRKQRIIVVDGEPFSRQAIESRDWNVHFFSRQTTGTQNHSSMNEIEMIEKLDLDIATRLRPAITEIWRRLGLDYFGIDCDIGPDGRMLIFEANSSMHALETRFTDMTARVELIKQKIVEMIMARIGMEADRISHGHGKN